MTMKNLEEKLCYQSLKPSNVRPPSPLHPPKIIKRHILFRRIVSRGHEVRDTGTTAPGSRKLSRPGWMERGRGGGDHL